MGQGQGVGTVSKEKLFARLFQASLDAAARNRVYWHIDLNCGSGYNDKVGCNGSPLVFMEEAMKSKRTGPIEALFCDNNTSAVLELQKRLRRIYDHMPAWPACVHVADFENAYFLEYIGEFMQANDDPQSAIGTCLCDPNGYNDMPVDALATFACRFPKIDIILNININLFKSVEGCKSDTAKVSEGHKRVFREWPTVKEITDRISRPCWMIRNPPKNTFGRHHFTQIIGRIAEIPVVAGSELFPIDSPDGRRIIGKLKRIDPDQGDLFEGM